MPVKLFSLKNVHDDEANEIRELLSDNSVDFYETPPGNWGVSSPAIWLKDDEQLNNAKSLIDHYQIERSKRIRNEFAALKREGKNRTIIDSFKENAVRLIVYLAIIAGLLYISIKPFINFAG